MRMVQEAILYTAYALATLFVSKRFTYEFSVPKYATILPLLFVIFLLVFLRALKKGNFSLRFNVAHVAFLSFVASVFLSNVSVLKNFPGLVRNSMDYSLYILVMFFVSLFFSNFFDEKEKIRRFLVFSVLLAGFEAFDLLLNFYGGIDLFLGKLPEAFNRGHARGTIGNVNFVTNFLALNLPLALYLLFSNDFENKRITSSIKVLSTVSAFLIIAGILVGQTRSVYFATIVSLAFLMVFYLSKKKRLEEPKCNPKVRDLSRTLGTALLVMAVLLVVLYSTPNPLTNIGKVSAVERVRTVVEPSAWHNRLLAWFAALYQWRDHKWIGAGIGTYQLLAIDYMREVMKEHPTFLYAWENFKQAHNDYLQVLGEMGIVGLSTLVFVGIALGYLFFKVLKNLKTKDDLLLFLSLASSFLVFMGDSFLSFPARLLPNHFLAIFVSSVAVGNYFLENRKLELGKKRVVVLFAFVFAVCGISTYLRWNYFVSEVHFKWGNTAYATLRKVEENLQELNGFETQVKNAMEELRNLSGRYSYLQPNSFKEFLKRQSPKVALSEIEMEKMRLEAIEKENARLKDLLNKIETARTQLLNEKKKQYLLAKQNFLNSARINQSYGRSQFYLAALSSVDLRLEELKEKLKGEEDFDAFFDQDFDEYQKAIPEDYKRKDLRFLADVPFAHVKDLGEENVLTAQMLLDSIAFYCWSLKTFNERNTYRTLALRYAGLHQLMKIFYNRTHDELLKKSFESLAERYFNEFMHYALRTIENVPGAWNRFPDWKNPDLRKAVLGEDVYRFFAMHAFNAQPLTSLKNREFLMKLAEMEIWACDHMSRMGVWAVPDALFDFLIALPVAYIREGHHQEGLFFFEKVLAMYKESYERVKKDRERFAKIAEGSYKEIVRNVEADISEKFGKEFAEKFPDFFANLVEKLDGYDWSSLLRQEYARFVNEKDPFFKLDPWNALIAEALRNYENSLKEKLLEPDKVTGVLVYVNNALRAPQDVLVYERYVRFLTGYRIFLEDAKRFLQMLERAYRVANEEEWKVILSDWSVNLVDRRTFNTKEEVLRELEEMRERLEELEKTL